MDEDERHEILSQVAHGILSPQEGAARLDELDRRPSRQAGAAIAVPGGSEPAATPVRRLRVVAQAGRAEVVADPTIHEAVAEGGPHHVSREGDTMVICLDNPDDPGYFFSQRAQGFSIGLQRLRSLRVRVNPDLAIQLDSQAGSVSCRGVRGRVDASVQAGSAQIEDCEGPLTVTSQAGSVKVRGRLLRGESSIRCEAGSVQVELLEGSSVRIQAAATMGKLSIDGASPESDGWGFGRASREVVVGGGAGSLSIEATMGSVRVVTGQ